MKLNELDQELLNNYYNRLTYLVSYFEQEHQQAEQKYTEFKTALKNKVQDYVKSNLYYKPYLFGLIKIKLYLNMEVKYNYIDIGTYDSTRNYWINKIFRNQAEQFFASDEQALRNYSESTENAYKDLKKVQKALNYIKHLNTPCAQFIGLSEENLLYICDVLYDYKEVAK